jgi:hypothetical protein
VAVAKATIVLGQKRVQVIAQNPPERTLVELSLFVLTTALHNDKADR